MACETLRKPQQTPEQRRAEVRAALLALEQGLQKGSISLVIGNQGAVAFQGWTPATRGGLTDACAFRTLQANGSWALKSALNRAEAMAGRKVDMNAVSAGVHSHDGGRTWGPGHGHHH